MRHPTHGSLWVRWLIAIVLCTLGRSCASAAGLGWPANATSHGFPDDIQHHVLLASTFNVRDEGAVGDGVTNDADAFQQAWKAACQVTGGSMLVPAGYTFMVSWSTFKGPCTGATNFVMEGTIVAPSSPKAWDNGPDNKWLVFQDLSNLKLHGRGTFNGRGQEWWAQKKSKKVTRAPAAVTMSNCDTCTVNGVKLVDSQQMHLVFLKSPNGVIDSVIITAPADSPNTDGIHIDQSTGVRVRNSHVTTGDDCVSIVKGSRNIKVSNVYCGPGCHGISVGSLGKDGATDTVTDVQVEDCTLSGTTNGLRIKTWQGGSGVAKNFAYSNIQMTNVKNPIVIDQNYCPNSENCPKSSRAVQVSDISYRNIKGTSATSTAMLFDCSEATPCTGITLSNINLKQASGGDAKSKCNNAVGWASQPLSPPSCLATPGQ